MYNICMYVYIYNYCIYVQSVCPFLKSDSDGDTGEAEELLHINKPLTNLNSRLIQMVSVHVCLCTFVFSVSTCV